MTLGEENNIDVIPPTREMNPSEEMNPSKETIPRGQMKSEEAASVVVRKSHNVVVANAVKIDVV
jgi:hypothetical protein